MMGLFLQWCVSREKSTRIINMYWLVVPPFREGTNVKRDEKNLDATPLQEFIRINIIYIFIIYIFIIYILYIVIFHDSLLISYSSFTSLSLQQDPLIKHVLSEHVRNPSARLSHPRWERENVMIVRKAQHRWSCTPFEMQITASCRRTRAHFIISACSTHDRNSFCTR